MVSSTSIRVRNTTNEETANNKSSFSKRRRPDSAYSSHQSIRDEEVSGEIVSQLRSVSRFCCKTPLRLFDPLTLTSDRQLLISPNCVFDASLVPETCLESPSLPVCFLDSIRQAKAEIRHGASCPTISMAPVLAITSLVARTAL